MGTHCMLDIYLICRGRFRNCARITLDSHSNSSSSSTMGGGLTPSTTFKGVGKGVNCFTVNGQCMSEVSCVRSQAVDVVKEGLIDVPRRRFSYGFCRLLLNTFDIDSIA